MIYSVAEVTVKRVLISLWTTHKHGDRELFQLSVRADRGFSLDYHVDQDIKILVLLDVIRRLLAICGGQIPESCQLPMSGVINVGNMMFFSPADRTILSVHFSGEDTSTHPARITEEGMKLIKTALEWLGAVLEEVVK